MTYDRRGARKRVRAGRVHARRLEEAARSFFDGLVVLFATLVGVATAHGAAWIILAVSVLVLVLIGRAVALWSLAPSTDQLLEALDAQEKGLDDWERHERS